MIPVIVALFGDYIVPEWFVELALGPVPFRVTPVLSLLYGICLLNVCDWLELGKSIKCREC